MCKSCKEEEENRAIETKAEVERQDCGDTINRDALGMVHFGRRRGGGEGREEGVVGCLGYAINKRAQPV